MSHKEIDEISGVATTGHEWDGIRELNTPLPRWWLGIFYASILWSIGYWVVYPAWPLLTDTTKGVIGYASRADISADMAQLKAQRAVQAAGMADATPAQIKADPTLFQIAMAQGKAAFGDNCAACHGEAGKGNVEMGAPNLVDAISLYGMDMASLTETISNSRNGVMPAWGGRLDATTIKALTVYVHSLGGGQ